MAGAEGKGAGPRVLLGQARHWFPATDLVPLSPGSGALQSFGRFRRKISRVSPGPLTPAPAAECAVGGSVGSGEERLEGRLHLFI